MKDPSGVIRSWLYTTLSGQVSYAGVTVPVYSFVPKDSAMPYILLAEQSGGGEEGAKESWIVRHTATLEVYTSSTGNDASYVPCNTIADSVLQKVRTRTSVTLSGFTVISVVVDNILTDRVDNGTNIIILKIINLSLLIQEN
jgi:hypothetical protein